MKRQRRKHTPEFKARVAIEAFKGMKTISEIAAEFEIHPVMIVSRKPQFSTFWIEVGAYLPPTRE